MKREHPHIEEGLSRLRTKWPQSFSIESQHGDQLVVVPSVLLPKGYDATICTVLFIAPCGFPAACPRHFFTDIEIRLANGMLPHYTRAFVRAERAYIGEDLIAFDRWKDWPAWKQAMRWFWKVQMWYPNRDTLFTFMNAIRMRLNPAR